VNSPVEYCLPGAVEKAKRVSFAVPVIQPARLFGRKRYKTRNQIERLINQLKQYRRLATRYEKLGVNFSTMWIIAFIFIWL
jgi:transposase